MCGTLGQIQGRNRRAVLSLLETTTNDGPKPKHTVRDLAMGIAGDDMAPRADDLSVVVLWRTKLIKSSRN
jgi:hypothetical protein